MPPELDRSPAPIEKVCAAVGLDARGAVPLHRRANTVYALPDAGAVVRLRFTHGSPEWRRRLANSVQVTRWLAEQGFPTITPLDIPQPVSVNGWVATFWRQETVEEPALAADVADLARILRRLHSLPPPPVELPATDPLGSLPTDLDRNRAALTGEEYDWLLNRCAEIAAEYPGATMPPELDHGLIHGDAHLGNLIPVAGAFLLADWDSVSVGPRAQDLIPTLHRVLHLGYPRTDWLDLCSAYGVDPSLEHHPGIRLLQKAREVRSLAAYIRRAAHPDVRRELTKRLRTLMTGDGSVWRAVTV